MISIRSMQNMLRMLSIWAFQIPKLLPWICVGALHTPIIQRSLICLKGASLQTCAHGIVQFLGVIP